MEHRKLEGLMSPMEKVARVASGGLRASDAQTSPSGAISLDNADGTRTIIGEVSNGEDNPSYTMATHVGDTTPPGIPTGITATSKSGVVVVEWDGTLSGGIPDDFFCVRIYLDNVELGALSEAGSVASAKLESGTTHSITATSEDDCCLPDGTPAHNVSDATQAISVTVSKDASEVMADIDEQIEGVEQEIADFKSNTYTKAQTDKKVQDLDDEMSTELTTNYYNKTQIDTSYATKTLVSQTKEEIELSASQTYATKGIGNPNLSPFYSQPGGSYETPVGTEYWTNAATPYGSVEQNRAGVGENGRALSDGWAHYDIDVSGKAAGGSASTSFFNIRCRADYAGDWKPSTDYTIMAEFRNVTFHDDATVRRIVLRTVRASTASTASIFESAGNNDVTVTEDTTLRIPVKTYADLSGRTQVTDGYLAFVAGALVSFDVRLSIFEGDYDGPFKPYVTDQQALGKTYATNSALTVGLDGIRQEVASAYQTIDAMGAYSTTAEMNTAIQTSATGIEQSVAATYSTKQATADAIAAIQVGGRNLITLAETYLGGVNQSTGADTSVSATVLQRRSGYIPVTGGESYCAQAWLGSQGEQNVFIFWYRADKSYIGYKATPNVDTHATLVEVAPSDAAFARIQWRTFGNGWAKFEQGNMPTDYTAAPEDLEARPNLVPYGSHDPSDAYNATSNPDGYWLTDWSASAVITELDDGWIHFERSNASGTGNLDYSYPRARPVPDLEPGEIVTLVVEFRNVTYTGNAHVYVQQVANAQLWGGNPQTCNVTNNSTMYLSDATTRRMVYVVDSAHKTGDYDEVVRFNHRLPAGASASYDFRVSLYRGGYEGGYVPYSIEDTTLSKTYTKSSTFVQTVDGLDGRITATEDGLAVQETLIRQYAGGVLVAYVGNSVGILINAAGKADIVNLTWSGNEPTVGTVISTYGTVTQIGADDGVHLTIDSNGITMYDGATEVARFAGSYVNLMEGNATFAYTGEGGATLMGSDGVISLVGGVNTRTGVVYSGFLVRPKGSTGHTVNIHGATLGVGVYKPGDTGGTVSLNEYPMHALQAALDLITPASAVYGATFNPASHKMKIACGTNVGTGTTQTVNFGVTFAGIACVVVSGGDDVGISGTVTPIADTYTATTFEAKKLGGSTGAWRVNWIAIGWVAI